MYANYKSFECSSVTLKLLSSTLAILKYLLPAYIIQILLTSECLSG